MWIGRVFSIRYKFFGVTAFLLTIAILTYLALAVFLFNTDKTAYIYDNNAALVNSLADQMSTEFKSTINILQIMGKSYVRSINQNAVDQKESELSAIKGLFEQNRDYVDVSFYEDFQNKNTDQFNFAYHLSRDDDLKPYHLDEGYFEKLRKEIPLPFNLIKTNKIFFQNSSIEGGLPLLTLAIAIPVKGETEGTLIVSVNLNQEKRIQTFKQSSVYTTYLIDSYGSILGHSDIKKLFTHESIASTEIMRDITSSPVVSGAKEYTNKEGFAKIVAFRKLPAEKLVMISEIPTEKAFLASKRLIEKSILFAILILSLSFIVSLLSTKRLTSALHRLYLATLKVAEGDFKVQVAVASRDEVGALALSFNKMTKEITRLMIETADKARMEKELETAQLVQDNFFPKEHLKTKNFELTAYFKSATECGGDWWGYQEVGDSIVLFIGDATGHGVPAALMTAVAHSTSVMLKKMFSTFSQASHAGNVTYSPALIMEFLNTAIYHGAKGKVKMTFFTASLDLNTGMLRYCNASHDMPLILPLSGEVDTLDGEPDACLGDKEQGIFKEYTYEFKKGDKLILFTDGLLDVRNKEGQEYGERRLIRHLKARQYVSVDDVKNSLLNEVESFLGDRKPDDDITFLVAERN